MGRSEVRPRLPGPVRHRRPGEPGVAPLRPERRRSPRSPHCSAWRPRWPPATTLHPASGAATSLLALYGLTVSGATDDGADGERSNGLAFPSALDLGATWDTAAATAYGAMLGSEFHRTGQSDVLGPVIDIDRTWHTGREQEKLRQDPFLTGVDRRARGPSHSGHRRADDDQALLRLHAGAGPIGPGALVVQPQQHRRERAGVRASAGGDLRTRVAGRGGASAGQRDERDVWLRDRQRGHHAPYAGADSCGNQFLLNDLVKGQYGFEGPIRPTRSPLSETPRS